MAASLITIAQNLDESLVSWAARLDSFLSGITCGVQGFDVVRQNGMSVSALSATFTLTIPGPVSPRARVFVGSPGSSAEDQANTWLAANPETRLISLKDVSDPQRRGLNNDAILIIYTSLLVSNCGQGRCRIAIAIATEEILPGASGVVDLVGDSGPTGNLITVQNRSAATWPMDGFGYIAPLLGTCDWVGFPSCCSAIPTTTTTTTTSTTTTTAPPLPFAPDIIQTPGSGGAVVGSNWGPFTIALTDPDPADAVTVTITVPPSIQYDTGAESVIVLVFSAHDPSPQFTLGMYPLAAGEAVFTYTVDMPGTTQTTGSFQYTILPA